ncbi:MAG TPA: TRAP transporter large permease subunit [Xanthobacteraceae bacterium]|nr:TRAP transporter large permease subunit [Xanthobacteraceae bacterium]
MSIGLLTVLFFLSLIVFLIAGLPLVFVLGGISIVFLYFTWGIESFYMVASQVWGSMNSFTLIAIPLFVYMAMILEKSGVAQALYRMMHLWWGGVRGGLAIGTVAICTLFAAMVGISGAAVVTMGTIALPAMFEQKYDKRMAIGCISAGGGLGILIPPSVLMILYSLITGASVGKMFAAGVIPGLMLALMICAYIFIRCWLQPEMGPALPIDQRGTWADKIEALRAVLLPMLIVTMVLGSIMLGIATPTEAAASGVLGALISAAVHRKLTWELVRESALRTFVLTGMIMWILFAAHSFSAAYQGMGATSLIQGLAAHIPGGPWGAIIVMQLVLLLLGMVLDPVGIMMITLPVFLPIITAYGFDPIWFGILFIINMEIGYQTPPFGFNLFYLKAIVPPNITMGDIYHSVTPYTLVLLLGLILVMLFPGLATWLPSIVL